MIFNQWYVVLDSKEVNKGKVVGVTRFGEKLVFGRNAKGDVICLRDKCAHRGAALSAGKMKGDRVQCPFHGFEYDSKGQCQLIPAYGRNAEVPPRFKVGSYVVQEKWGLIWLWYGNERSEYPSLPLFEELEKFSYASYRDTWNVHYSRAIENQLDVVHLPFVHHNTIGRGNKTLVDGPKAKLVDDEIQAWVFNRQDDGTPALKPDQLTEPDYQSIVKFRFPNIWRLGPSPKLKIFVAFTPVDENNTVLYMRFCQRIIRIPLLSHLFNFLGKAMSKVILKQDKRVVITQQPKKSALKMEENLIRGDLPIVLYRRRRQELIDQNAQQKI